VTHSVQTKFLLQTNSFRLTSSKSISFDLVQIFGPKIWRKKSEKRKKNSSKICDKLGERRTKAEQEVLALIAPLGKLGRFEEAADFFSS